MNIQQIVLTVAGVYNITMALLMHTPNIKSSIILKIIPFFIGLACLYAGWIIK